MMLNELRNDLILRDFIRERCEDEGLCVEIDPRINQKDVIILKVDDYYNSFAIEKRPASPDCLIIVRCADNTFSAIIVEMKNIDYSAGFTVENMKEKFETCLNDFMCKRFPRYFDREFKRITLYFLNKIELHRAPAYDDNLKTKILMNTQFDFRGRPCKIQLRFPTTAIKPC